MKTSGGEVKVEEKISNLGTLLSIQLYIRYKLVLVTSAAGL